MAYEDMGGGTGETGSAKARRLRRRREEQDRERFERMNARKEKNFSHYTGRGPGHSTMSETKLFRKAGRSGMTGTITAGLGRRLEHLEKGAEIKRRTHGDLDRKILEKFLGTPMLTVDDIFTLYGGTR